MAGVSINSVCKRAGVHPTTFSRWKKSPKNPDPIGANLHSIGKLYAALREISADESKVRAAPRSAHRLCGAAK